MIGSLTHTSRTGSMIGSLTRHIKDRVHHRRLAHTPHQQTGSIIDGSLTRHIIDGSLTHATDWVHHRRLSHTHTAWVHHRRLSHTRHRLGPSSAALSHTRAIGRTKFEHETRHLLEGDDGPCKTSRTGSMIDSLTQTSRTGSMIGFLTQTSRTGSMRRLSHPTIKDWVHDRLSHTNIKDWVHETALSYKHPGLGP